MGGIYSVWDYYTVYESIIQCMGVIYAVGQEYYMVMIHELVVLL